MTDMISVVARALLVKRYSGYAGYGEYEPGEVEIEETLPEAKAFIKALEAKGLVIVPREPNVASIANGVQFLIDANLDGPDGVGHSDAVGVWDTMLAALEGKDG